ncbi:hypothetical protein CYK37_05035 [Mesorhizobium loti]|nr:hypothetical protein [Mesorhizobium loti]PLP60502.1 hypothetical protein CYK37_05035 [Mesorhizobium loti]
MTDRVGQLLVAATGRLSLALILAGGLALAGCASSSSGPSVAVQSGGSVTGPKDTGTFPNLNIKPQNAATQFTEDEKNAKLAQLSAAKSNVQAHPGDPAAAADAVELDKLKASHAKDALKQIGAKCDPALDPNCK